MTGCGSVRYIGPGSSEPIVNEHGDTAHEAEVRAWITNEVIHLQEKKDTAQEMLNKDQITYEEYFEILDQIKKEHDTIVPRAKEKFLPKR